MAENNILTSEYWDSRYEDNTHKWDIGSSSTPIVNYINQLKDKSIRILIPGCGNAYEAKYLFNLGFKNVYILDYAKIPLLNFSKNCPSFPKNQLLNIDFFKHNDKYDLIIEQTFFCALSPSMRENYVKHISNLLKPKGKLVGLLFNSQSNTTEPPFGGDKEEYENLFSSYFKINSMENCYNSIEPRMGKELFFNLSKNV